MISFPANPERPMPVFTSRLVSATSCPSTAPWGSGQFRTALPMWQPLPTVSQFPCISMACSSRPAVASHQNLPQPLPTCRLARFIATMTSYSRQPAHPRRPRLPVQPPLPMPTKLLSPGWKRPSQSSRSALLQGRRTSRPIWKRFMVTRELTTASIPALITG